MTHRNQALGKFSPDAYHEELAVDTIREPTVPGNDVTEILDFESALEAACEETAKRCNERGKAGNKKGVPLERCYVHVLDLRSELRNM